MYSGTVTNAEDYYSVIYSVTDRRTNDVEIAAAQRETANVNYCFGEVLVRFRSTGGTFWNPRVQFSAGAFQGTNFLGQPADYSVYMDYAAGLPDTQANATNQGVVAMYLPEGTYTLQPTVTPGDSAYGATGLQPVTLTVGCGQRIAIEPCLQVNLNAPVGVPVPPNTRQSCSKDSAAIALPRPRAGPAPGSNAHLDGPHRRGRCLPAGPHGS
jgi:hypothetical protein